MYRLARESTNMNKNKNKSMNKSIFMKKSTDIVDLFVSEVFARKASKVFSQGVNAKLNEELLSKCLRVKQAKSFQKGERQNERGAQERVHVSEFSFKKEIVRSRSNKDQDLLAP